MDISDPGDYELNFEAKSARGHRRKGMKFEFGELKEHVLNLSYNASLFEALKPITSPEELKKADKLLLRAQNMLFHQHGEAAGTCEIIFESKF